MTLKEQAARLKLREAEKELREVAADLEAAKDNAKQDEGQVSNRHAF